jgi:N-acyl-D-amino-acid deacylase
VVAASAQTGTPVPSLAPLDDIMRTALSRYSIPGGALAVVKDGRLVFARGYGLADVEANEPVQPQSLFRYGSASKTPTAAAIMRLVEDGKLDLDARIFDILNQYGPYNGKWGDSRLHNITVRQVLHHTGGWDRDKSGDPTMPPTVVDASNALHAPFPPSQDVLIRYMLARKLDFDPGSRWAYSNFGYMLLGCVLEKLSGKTYDDYVRQVVLDPLGLARVQHGSSHLEGRLPGEVKYYDYAGAPLMKSNVSPGREKVPAPYGAVNLELNPAAGGWIGSAIDMVKFAAMLDGQRPRALMTPVSMDTMLAQTPAAMMDYQSWYGFGMMVAPFGPGGIFWYHGGYIPGARSLYIRMPGFTYAYVFNGNTKDSTIDLDGYAGQAIYDYLATVTEWPEHDLFPQYFAPRIAPSGVVNSASFQTGPAAPGSLLSIMGVDLGGRDAGASVTIHDASGADHPLNLLYSGPQQLNTALPDDVAIGAATVTVTRADQPAATASLTIAPVSPGIFALNADGLAAAVVTRATPGQPNTYDRVYDVDASGHIVARPISFGPDAEELYLSLYATGLRGEAGLAGVNARIGDYDAQVTYVGAQTTYAGLDQINVRVPRTLAGAGTVDVHVTVDGLSANTTRLTFQ